MAGGSQVQGYLFSAIEEIWDQPGLHKGVETGVSKTKQFQYSVLLNMLLNMFNSNKIFNLAFYDMK